MWWECNLVCKLIPRLLLLPRFPTKITAIPTKVFWENHTVQGWWLIYGCGMTCFAQNQAGGNIWPVLTWVCPSSSHKPQSLQIFELLVTTLSVLSESWLAQNWELYLHHKGSNTQSIQKSIISKVSFLLNFPQTTVQNKFWYSVTLFFYSHFSFFITCIN